MVKAIFALIVLLGFANYWMLRTQPNETQQNKLLGLPRILKANSSLLAESVSSNNSIREYGAFLSYAPSVTENGPNESTTTIDTFKVSSEQSPARPRHKRKQVNQTKRNAIIAAARAERAAIRKARDAARPPCPTLPRTKTNLGHWKKIHFVHVPKAAGTAMGQALRALVCQMNADRGAFEKTNGLNCCLNRTKFCDLGGKCMTPGCSAILGCELCECWHLPALKHMKDTPSITMIRDPVQRAISGYLFRGHSPNWDRFNVRNEFAKHPGQGRHYSYDEYLDDLFEYHNPITRMVVYDSFPYANITISVQDIDLAKRRLEKFAFVGIQEAFEASVKLLLHKFSVILLDDTWRREVASQRCVNKILFQSRIDKSGPYPHLSLKLCTRFVPKLEKRMPRQLAAIKRDGERLTAKSKRANFADMQIYSWAVKKFCM